MFELLEGYGEEKMWLISGAKPLQNKEVTDYLLDEFHRAGIWLKGEVYCYGAMAVHTAKADSMKPGQIVEYGPKCEYRYKEDVMSQWRREGGGNATR